MNYNKSIKSADGDVILWVNCGWIIMKMCNFAC